jgi:hypothetical protein
MMDGQIWLKYLMMSGSFLFKYSIMSDPPELKYFMTSNRVNWGRPAERRSTPRRPGIERVWRPLRVAMGA